MSTISQNLTRLQTAKTAIADAIVVKGGTVNSGDGFEDFSFDVLTIPTSTTPKAYVEFTGTRPFTLRTWYSSTTWKGTIEYSTDSDNWTIWTDPSTNELSSNDKNKLFLRGYDNTSMTNIYSSGSLGDPTTFVFTTDGTITCSGKLESLLDFRLVAFGYEPKKDKACFKYLFSGCSQLTNVPEFRTDILTEQCFYAMFRNCTSLVTAPNLSATELTAQCYCEMFSGCTSLLNVQSELPALTLVSGCYSYMFNGCTSLEEAPDIAATSANMSSSGYTGSCFCMFNGCSSLIKAPTELYISQPTYRFYECMFKNCTSLQVPPIIDATASLAGQSTYGKVFYQMFYNCTSLSKLPYINVKTLRQNDCQEMFYGCSNIRLSTTKTGDYQTSYRIPTTGTGSVGTNGLSDMFTNTGGTFTGTPSINTTYYTSNEVI